MVKSDVPMYSMSHLHRGDFRARDMPKCLHDTTKLLKMSHHHNNGCVRRQQCRTYDVQQKDGYILHYRIGWKVSDQCKGGDCVLYDPTILKYKDRLEQNMKNVLNNILNLNN